MTLKRTVDSGVGLAVSGIHHKFDDLALGDADALRKFGGGGIAGACGVVAVNCGGGPGGKLAKFGDFGGVFGGLGRLGAATSTGAIRGGLPDAGGWGRGGWRDAGNGRDCLRHREVGDEQDSEAEFHGGSFWL